jgi:hypothetical protein
VPVGGNWPVAVKVMTRWQPPDDAHLSGLRAFGGPVHSIVREANVQWPPAVLVIALMIMLLGSHLKVLT